MSQGEASPDIAPDRPLPHDHVPRDMALREAVLAGQYFGARHGETAAGLALWLTEGRSGPVLRDWFGQAGLRRLLDEAVDRDDAQALLEEAIDRDLVALDALMSRQLDVVLHHSRMSQLEGSWRGLSWLVGHIENDRAIRLRLLPARWAELARDLERAADFDQSILFRKLHDDEFGMPGGEPYGLLLADYEVHPAPSAAHPVDDVMVLQRLASVAAAAFAPVVLAASPAFLGLESFATAGPATDLATALRRPDRIRWRSLEAREDSRFLALLLPRTLARPAWRCDGTRPDLFRYSEYTPDAEARVWMTPVYAFAAVALRAFTRYRWPGELRGAEPAHMAMGGVVETLPTERLRSDPPGPAPRPPLELELTDAQERMMAEAQLVSLCGLDGLPEASFSALPTLYRPPRMTTAAADANQRLSAQLNNVLCVSRFAHCIKVMGRDLIGSFYSPPEVELRLSRWISGFVSGLAGGGGETAARYPLRSAQVEVREQPGRPGVYGCVVHLQPHYQLDDVGAVFRLVTDLSGPKAA